MKSCGSIVVVTGTGTGVGKTVLTALLTRHLIGSGKRVLALKPICSGGREDARTLRQAGGNELTLDEVNPWAFREGLSPSIAAQRERRSVHLVEVLVHIRALSRRAERFLLVEGAGGLLSPLGIDFDARDLVRTLGATPVIVAPNRLGTLNEALLTLEALPAGARRRARIVLMNPRRSDLAARTNLAFLRSRLGSKVVHALPWLPNWRESLVRELSNPVARSLQTLWSAVDGGR